MQRAIQKLGGFLVAVIVAVGCALLGGVSGDASFLARTVMGQGASAMAALAVLFALGRWVPSLGLLVPNFGHVARRDWLQGFAVIFGLYAMHHGFVLASDQPQEKFMAEVVAMNWRYLLLVVLVIVTVVPLNEELLFRHVLPGMPSQPKPKLDLDIVLRSALACVLFWCLHSQYEHASTKLLVAAVGLTCLWARWATGGLALPIALHALASVLAVIFNFFYR